MSKKKDHEPNETTEMWREIKAEGKQHRHDKQNWSEELLQRWCLDNSVDFRKVADYQFRLTKGPAKIDIYPQSQKWHNLKDNQRGKYKELLTFVSEHFK